jgi:hypothetical protein
MNNIERAIELLQQSGGCTVEQTEQVYALAIAALREVQASRDILSSVDFPHTERRVRTELLDKSLAELFKEQE